MKKTLLIVVDALATRVVRPALNDGRLPNLSKLVQAGIMAEECTPIFPSITPAATCGIATGCYTSSSGIAGAYFYDVENDRVYYYGDDFWIILTEGFAEFFDDFVVKLNFKLLRCETLFEIIERAGFRAACLNYFWFRGGVEHEVNFPWLLKIIPGVPFSKSVTGPQTLCLGDFVTTEPRHADEELSAQGGPFRRFGFDDRSTADYLLELARKTKLPDFTIAYFPDNDFRSHEVGPERAVEVLEQFDETLGKLFDVWGGAEQMLEEVCVFVTGDHSQTDVLADADQAWVNLDEVLHGFSTVKAGEQWTSDDQLMVCSNMRAAQIYLHRGYWSRREKIVRQLLADERVDQVIWRNDTDKTDLRRYHVATRDRGTLRFWPARGSDSATLDQYGGRWAWEGELATVDGRIDKDERLEFPEYPNAFERIATSFREDITGDMWVTARPGYEFHTPRTVVHSGGSHGSLCREDSTVPLIVAGAPHSFEMPARPRTVDVAPLILSIFGIEPRIPAGVSHVAVGEAPGA